MRLKEGKEEGISSDNIFDSELREERGKRKLREVREMKAALEDVKRKLRKGKDK